MESVINQTYRTLEIILVDDGSTDKSLKICQQYANRDSRIQVVHQSNEGVSSARNRGLQKAMGKYATFIDGDDTIALDYVEKYVDQAISTKADIIIGGLTKLEHVRESIILPLSGNYNKAEFLSLLCKESTEIYGYVCCKLYNLSLLRNHNIIFNEKMSSQEDFNFALSVYEHANAILCFNNSGYYYNYNPPTRKASAESILGNQVKLYNIAKNAGSDSDLMIPRFQSVLYTWLYHADSVQVIKDIINMDIPDALLKEIDGQRKEIKYVISSFRAKKAYTIYRYFSVRGVFRSALVKLRIIKPVQ